MGSKMNCWAELAITGMPAEVIGVLDPLAWSFTDPEPSQYEERWITIGTSATGAFWYSPTPNWSRT